MRACQLNSLLVATISISACCLIVHWQSGHFYRLLNSRMRSEFHFVRKHSQELNSPPRTMNVFVRLLEVYLLCISGETTINIQVCTYACFCSCYEMLVKSTTVRVWFMRHTCKQRYYLPVTLPGCWIRPGLQFRHMLWKASTAINHPAILQRWC